MIDLKTKEELLWKYPERVCKNTLEKCMKESRVPNPMEVEVMDFLEKGREKPFKKSKKFKKRGRS